MTARGELYVDENCRDVFENQLNKWYGKDKWYLDGSPFYDVWEEANMPEVMKVDVLDDENNKIGEVEIQNAFNIVEENFERHIEIEPKKIKRLH